MTILDVFEGRKQLIAYFHAWWPGQPAAEQCEGCTFFNSQIRELSYIHSRDATYATVVPPKSWRVPYAASRVSAVVS
jgi:predicted dithiol-disulfide oxidoreductase (DUF899 family)